LMCPLVFLSIQSGRGIRTTATLSLVAGLAISIWIIVNSALSGFQYRGDVDINQNVAAFVVGLSLIVGISLLLTPHKNDGPLRQVALVLVTGAMGYAILLLASRGMTIALVVALFTTLASILTWHRGALRTALFALLALSATLLLPGGTGLFERFEGESVDSAGDRIPIWLAVVEDAKDGSLRELAFGHGFRASRPIVRSATGVLESTHNAYLALLYEYGTFGLSVFLALHGAIAAMALSRPNRYSSMAFGIVCFLLVANVSSTDHEDFMYWLALGFAVACVTFGWQAAGRTPPMNIERCNP
ncbi:MAG: O-antigen ligase family protein, partial [Trueperaceae bacterium]